MQLKKQIQNSEELLNAMVIRAESPGVIAHGDGDGGDGIDRKVNTKINATTYEFFNLGFLKEKIKK